MPVLSSAAVEPIVSKLDSEASLGVIMAEQGPLPLHSVGITAHIDQLFAEVQVRQGYVNPHPDTIEATYIFPLPDRAAVTRFQAKLGDRLIEGILKERAAARQEYEEAIQRGHRAAIAEEDRPNVFSMRIGNMLPGETAEIELTLTMPLAYEDGEATLRFPLVVAPRYIPGNALDDQNVGLGIASDTDAVPDASRISPPVLLPGYPFPVKLDIQIALAKDITPTANMQVEAQSINGTHASWKVNPGHKLDRDFLFRFPVASDTIVSQCMITPDADNPAEGTLALTVVPPKHSVTQAKPRPRRIVFVFDRSGSMSGWKIVAARRSLGRMIDTLSAQDHFAIIAFDNSFETWPRATGIESSPPWYNGTDSQRFRAIETLAGIYSRGGTEMLPPLTRAVEMLASSSPEEDRILVFITDGQVGNEDQLLQQLGSKLQGIRLFILGVDMAANTSLLNRLAQACGGSTECVESEERLDEVMLRIHRRIAAPVLTSFAWSASGIELNPGSAVPKKVNDLFPEAPIVIFSRCSLPARGTLHLQGIDEGGKPWQQTLTPKIQSSPVILRSWARAKLREMEDDFAANRNNRPQAIVEHSLKYQVLSRFTAFVAVDRSAVVNPNGQPREIIQAVEYPAGWVRQNAIPEMTSFQKCERRDAVEIPERDVTCCVLKDRDVEFVRRSSFGMAPASVSLEGVRLQEFRQRAAQTLKDYELAAANNRLAALSLFSEIVAALIVEMKAANMPSDEIHQLEEAQKLLVKIIADIKLADAKLKHALDAIQNFADGHFPKPKSLLRKLFWK